MKRLLILSVLLLAGCSTGEIDSSDRCQCPEGVVRLPGSSPIDDRECNEAQYALAVHFAKKHPAIMERFKYHMRDDRLSYGEFEELDRMEDEIQLDRNRNLAREAAAEY